MPRGVFRRYTYEIVCRVDERILRFPVGRFDYAARFRWLCRDGRCLTVNLYRDSVLYRSWHKNEPLPMLLEERGARAA